VKQRAASPGPKSVWLVRHGESAGNVAHQAAEQVGGHEIEIAGRDMDVPLSDLGRRQSRALGRWIAALDDDEKPTVLLASPYARARQTAELLVVESRLNTQHLAFVVDERLREREFGGLDRLTKTGIMAQFPQEAARRQEVGKFYYRPPGGESWCDVILRLRSVLDHIELRYAEERVLVVAHQVIVLCFRYLMEELDEERILAVDAERDVANCSLTRFEHGEDPAGRAKLLLRAYNFVAPLEEAGEPVTTEPDPVVIEP
jgi:2,3-bisphosphoglycerate-dependent phosphoglycerate mutase